MGPDPRTPTDPHTLARTVRLCVCVPTQWRPSVRALFSGQSDYYGNIEISYCNLLKGRLIIPVDGTGTILVLPHGEYDPPSSSRVVLTKY